MRPIHRPGPRPWGLGLLPRRSRPMSRYRFVAATALVALALTGCAANKDTPPAGQADADGATAELAKLPPDDRALAEAQRWCVVNDDERLGSMGVPLKLDIKGRPVFVCCKGCKKKAEANPDRTLATLDELKAKARAEKGVKE